MVRYSLCFVLFFLVTQRFVSCEDLTETQINKLCEDLNIATCDQCIQAHPDCAWCAVPLSGAKIKRCRTHRKLKQLGECPSDQIKFLESTTPAKNDTPLSEPSLSQLGPVVQLQPQVIQINIRRGDRVKFNITFRKVTDYPVDLYYLMDLSHSMLDDLKTLQRLGQSLADDIKTNVTSNIQMGFGTFVDKVMMPFASTVTEQLQNPCAKNQEDNVCAPPFGFKHQQSISDQVEKFRTSVANTTISGNIDSPEGSFDALMQIAVCGDKIGWRADATHLVIVTTDASFHMALDGKLAAILEANDMKCHLSKGANPNLPADTVYDKSKYLDYPSIGQLRAAFKDNKIQPIFAVTKEVRSLYEELRQLIPNSYVDELANDSSNIIGIISAAYNQLRGKLDMSLDENIPPEISLRYRVLCPNRTDWKNNSLSCDQIQIGSEIVYEFEAIAEGCPSQNIMRPLTFTSSSLQEDVKIFFNFLCNCECSKHPVVSSVNCSTNGSLVCGVCECDSGHEGAQCQCIQTQADVSLLSQCKQNGENNDDICEGNGVCECGTCVCNEGYRGQFCQCSSKGCPTSNDGICGGADKGTCENCDGIAKCNCKNGWTLHPEIQTCNCHDDLCKANVTSDVLCSSNGECDCNRCKCFNDSTIYSGQFCDVCINPVCKPVVECEGTSMQSCAQCVNEAQRLRENQNEKCFDKCADIDYTLLTSIPDCTNCFDSSCSKFCEDIDVNIAAPKDCQAFLANSECTVQFDIVWRKSTNDYQLLVKEFDKAQDCPQPINPLLIVLPIVAGIVLLGLLALIAWKIFQTMRDKREWLSFENEMKQSKWTKGQNPIFEKPSTRFENPTFHGN
ncbi:integrin beta pat-3-like isoform X2 [Clavelina lepadiformis]|uniref:Integrin beta n=1 Tax=Clavelina lepadiformis TaxID=159417 RepID=A0ABP0GTC6_CLALP